jgi:hypothetical protein
MKCNEAITLLDMVAVVRMYSWLFPLLTTMAVYEDRFMNYVVAK